MMLNKRERKKEKEQNAKLEKMKLYDKDADMTNWDFFLALTLENLWLYVWLGWFGALYS